MTIKRAFWLITAAVALASAGCAQDPLRIPNTGDGDVIANDGGGDGNGSTDGTTNLDGRVDVKPDVRPDLSYDACIAQVEACNNADDNCNGQIDEGYDKQNDARYCENCKGCKQLISLNAVPGCKAGKCVISSCAAGYKDLNNNPADGCEYKCTPTGSAEICDGIDNDCNGKIDDGVSLGGVNICKTQGPCAGTKAVCKGKDGWVCNYGANVELQPCTTDADCGTGQKCDTAKGVCPNVVIVDERLCDGIDGDCDGLADDPWSKPGAATKIGDDCDVTKACPNGNSDCDTAGGSTCSNGQCTPKKGVCRDLGAYTCKSDKTGVECKLKTAGKAPSTEKCNNIDDNCDGIVDNNVTDEQWVTVGTYKIFKYEASRPDATNTNGGTAPNGRPCSVPNRLPWVNVTRDAARNACRRVGGYLCTSAAWQVACRGASSTAFPYGNTFSPSICNGRAYDPNKDAALVTQLPSGCLSKWGAGGSIHNMSGNVKEWVAKGSTYEIRGGAYDTPSIDQFGAGLSCNYVLPAPTSSTLQLPTIGFRCCK